MTSSLTSPNPSFWLGYIDQADRFSRSDEPRECISERLGEFLSNHSDQLKAEANSLSLHQLTWVYRRVRAIQPQDSRIQELTIGILDKHKDKGQELGTRMADSVQAAIKERQLEELRAGLDRWVLNPQVNGKKKEAAERILRAFEGDSPILNLHGFFLDGLPPEIGSLWALKELNLGSNLIRILPPEIGNLQNLESLKLEQVPLESLPPEIGSLGRLKKLEVDYGVPARFAVQRNGFQRRCDPLWLLERFARNLQPLDTLPKEIGKLQNLEVLKLCNAPLKSLPPEIGNLRKLKVLGVRHGHLKGLPPEIGNLTELVHLTIFYNKLLCLPPEIGRLVALEYLDLAGNALSELPSEFGKLTALKELYLNSNQLSSLPKTLGNLRDLEYLNLLNNKLTEIRPELGNLGALRYLVLEKNKIGALPRTIAGLTSLRNLNLQSNRLQSLPIEVGNLVSLESLELSYNRLEFLPSVIGDLVNLRCITLHYNPSLNTLPLNLGNLSLNTYFSIEGTGIPEEERTAILAACTRQRLKAAAVDLPIHLELWKRVARFKENLAPDLSFILDFPMQDSMELSQATIYDWLVRLEKTHDFNNAQRPLAKTVCEILASLKENASFKSVFFAQVTANLENCEDRAAMALNELYTCWRIENLSEDTLAATFRAKMELLVGLAKTFALRKELAERIAEHNCDTGESVEIYLYYETLLRKPLGLVTAIEGMTHRDLGRREWLPIEEIQEAVEARYLDELLELSAFKVLADAHMPAPLLDLDDFDAHGEMERLEALYECDALTSEKFQEAAKKLMQRQQEREALLEQTTARREWAQRVLKELNETYELDAVGGSENDS